MWNYKTHIPDVICDNREIIYMDLHLDSGLNQNNKRFLDLWPVTLHVNKDTECNEKVLTGFWDTNQRSCCLSIWIWKLMKQSHPVDKVGVQNQINYLLKSRFFAAFFQIKCSQPTKLMKSIRFSDIINVDAKLNPNYNAWESLALLIIIWRVISK